MNEIKSLLEDADVYGQSLPNPVQFVLNVGLKKRIATAGKATFEGLAKAGYEVDFCEDESGVCQIYAVRAGGYYLDVGCAQLISMVRQGQANSLGDCRFDENFFA